MARPRIFISSTFYDLRQIREDLEKFIKDIGYEAIRHETGNIPYGKEKLPEDYAYKEVELSDIIVSIIGGRYGSESKNEAGNSISQLELKRALDLGIQVYILIDKNVLSEYETYKLNKDNKSVKYSSVDNIKIFQFIEKLYQLPKNNPIYPFETSSDIIKYLKLQWAGLFQRFLEQEKRIAEFKILEEMKSVSNTLKQMVNFLTEERKNKDDAIRNILLINHPAFRRFAEITNTKYRVFFSTKEELNKWLKARRWEENLDVLDNDSIAEWFNEDGNQYIKLSKNIFDKNGKLKIFTENDWSDDWIKLIDISTSDDEELPF